MNKFNISSFPQFVFDEYRLRSLSLNDKKEIFALRSNEKINKYLDRTPYSAFEEAVAFIEKILHGVKENKWLYWGIANQNTDKIIGTICLWNFSEDGKSAEVGFELDNDFQGKGIMSKALKIIIEYGFSVLELKRIEGYTHKENQKAARLMEKFGFKLNQKLTPVDNNIVYILEKQFKGHEQ